MYSELIEKLNPKPTFNLNWYKNEDIYSDGPIEDTIIKLIAENQPEDYSDAILNHLSWPTYYYLTHIRKNILNWYPFAEDSSVLEIGCGLGAITNMLCDRCRDVTAVELSKRRATAALLRCRERDNLEIIVGNLNDIKFEKKFDYITLIGVLEYQGAFANTDTPYLDFLVEIKKLLKPNGKLLLGIENKYGLKYWCGAVEDHTGVPFEGMNQYTLSNKKIRTFSRKELEEMVKDSGFKNAFFYYPMPDYKLPTVVYSQEYLPQNANMQNLRPYYIPNNSTLVADEMAIYQDVIENNTFEFFANSFLVECSDAEDVGKVTFSCFGTERQKKYQIATVFTEDGTVEKIPLHKTEGAEHIQQIVKNSAALVKAGRDVLPVTVQDGKLICEYVKGELLEDRVLSIYREKDTLGAYQLMDKVYQEILSSSEQVNAENNIFYTLELDREREVGDYGPILRIGYLDMTLRNAFYVNEKIQWFDQEWILEYVPAGYIMYRTITSLYQMYPWVEKVIPLEEIGQRYGLMSAWKKYEWMENLFSHMVLDTSFAIQSQAFRGVDREACLRNIKKLIGME